MDRQLPPGIPPGTLPIVRSGTGAGIYTVPALRRLRITHAWGSTGSLIVNTAATAGLGIVTDLGVARTVAGAGVSVSATDIPVETATIVNAVGGIAGFSGYEYTPLPGQDV